MHSNKLAVLEGRDGAVVRALAGDDKRGPKAPFLLAGYAGIQPAIHKRVPAGAPAGAGSYSKLCQCVPGSAPARCHLWVEFVFGSRLAPRVFLPDLQFCPSVKTSTPNSISSSIEGSHDYQLRLTWLLLLML